VREKSVTLFFVKFAVDRFFGKKPIQELPRLQYAKA
jgi:hypothetical protein